MSLLPSITPDVVLGGALALLSLLTYGACMVLVSVGMRNMRSEPGSLLAAAAGVPTGLLISSFLLAFGGVGAGISAWAVVAFALAGILSTYLGRWLVFKSIELIGPSGASALQSTSPLLTALFAWVLLGETIGWMGMLGITLAILGLVSMSLGLQRRAAGNPAAAVGGSLAAGGARRSNAMVWGTLLFGIASSAAYSGSHIFRGSAVRIWNEPVLGTTIGAAAGLLALLLASRKKLPDYRREILANRQGAALFAGIGVLQFLAQSLVIASMKYIPVSVAALISMCTPLVVMPISYFVMRNQEKLNGVMVLGILITLSGTAMSLIFAGKH
jgi:drug/metabolite transporter (DMT)-like permease